MNCTIGEYIEDVKSQLVCNQTGETKFVTYGYTNEEVDKYKKYFKYTLKQDLSAYKALLFFGDYLRGDYNIKSYQIVYKKEE